MLKYIINFFDKLEDKVRGHLSEHPITYALIASVGVVLLWRGIWHLADEIPLIRNSGVSIIVGSIILLITGVFVSAFIGNSVILTGLRKEKKLTEKTKDEIQKEIGIEKSAFGEIKDTLAHIEQEIQEIKDHEKKD
ncbi:MAG: hypothetical protein WC763_02230 [Candidatus Paceibacterota bacterium]|jgi:low affinity Fe/Cu permease